MGGGPGGALTSQRRPTNFGALSTYKICASEWAADALAAWGVCPGVLFARGGDAGCARGRGGPLGGGRTLPIAATVGKCCARWQILRPLRIDFFSLALIFGVKNTLACAQYIGRNQHTYTQKLRPRWASSTHKQKDGNMLALGLFGLSIDDENMRPENRFRHPAPDPAKTSKSPSAGYQGRHAEIIRGILG